MVYQKRKMPVLLFGNKLDLCAKGDGREVCEEAAACVQQIKGVVSEGSGFIDHSFEKGLKELLKSKSRGNLDYFCEDIVFEGEEKARDCCC